MKTFFLVSVKSEAEDSSNMSQLQIKGLKTLFDEAPNPSMDTLEFTSKILDIDLVDMFKW